MVKKEDFEDWLENPVTREVFLALKNAAAHSKMLWGHKAWESPFLTMENQIDMAELKAKSRICEDVSELSYETLMSWSRND